MTFEEFEKLKEDLDYGNEIVLNTVENGNVIHGNVLYFDEMEAYIMEWTSEEQISVRLDNVSIEDFEVQRGR